MTNYHDNKVKPRFKKDFNDGDLFRKWHTPFDDADYLSKWAAHRMQVALKSVDSYGLCRKPDALEIGIGSGIFIKELEKRGCNEIGVDYSINIVRSYLKKLNPAEDKMPEKVIVADVETLPIASNSFDLVTCLGVLEYLPNDKIALSEMYRIIRPNGYLVLAVASYHRFRSLFRLVKDKLFKKELVASETSSQDYSLENQVRLIRPLSLRQEAIDAGFKIRKFVCFGGKFFGRYLPVRFQIPGLICLGDHCLLVLKKSL